MPQTAEIIAKHLCAQIELGDVQAEIRDKLARLKRRLAEVTAAAQPRV
jgi:hypothetical protein